VEVAPLHGSSKPGFQNSVAFSTAAVKQSTSQIMTDTHQAVYATDFLINPNQTAFSVKV
jgi:hypothetical protein